MNTCELLNLCEFSWTEQVIAGLIGAIITGLGALLVRWLRKKYRLWHAASRNISEGEALKVARRTIGPKVLDAIPFRNKDSEQQYIAFATKIESDEFPKEQLRVDLLEGAEGAYRRVDLGLRAYRMFFRQEKSYFRSSYGVADVDKDGNKEVYSIFQSGGNSYFGYKITVYDILTLDSYWLFAEGTNRTNHWRFDTSPNVSQKRGLHGWLLQKLYETNSYFDPKRLASYSLMGLIEEWEGTNGKGFTEGKVNITEHSGKIPDTQAHPVHSGNDDNYKWVLPFRGPVLGYDKVKDAHFVVYVPVAWETIGGLAVGKRYLWLRPEMGDYILAYDKQNQNMEKINWPERSQGRDVRTVVEDLRKNREGGLLPSHINATEEFDNVAFIPPD